jgi:alanyl-tRNA synthetase
MTESQHNQAPVDQQPEGKWTHRRIRRTYLDYFIQHSLNHREVEGSPIIPRDDPTLLFCNAGMNQFKSALLGEEKRDYTRATSVQPCVRAGGKHNDLDNVGKNGRHLTWFEMLGNWSFGDYGKRETINMAWDISVNVLKLDVSRIYISVYKDDDESYNIWHDEVGVDPSHIYRFGDLENGDDENFWSMGPVGPCGPCTELFYDLGPEAGTSPDDVMGGEGDRYMEYWNNVFMQYNRDEDGNLTPLPALSVDTGMGLERIVMILQGKLSVFDIDLFQSLIGGIAEMVGADPNHPERKIDLQIIADHIRSLTFVISEGGQFSNEGRGYVLRRILRRAVRHGKRLGFEGPFLYKIAPLVAREFEGVYTLPAHIIENTATTLKDEEERFFRTIDRGMGRIHMIMDQRQDASERMISGVEAFELYDTFGFPVDLTEIEAAERGFNVDIEGFAVEMEAQRARSRQHARFYDDEGGEWVSLSEGGGHGFAGYGLSEMRVTVQRYRQDDERVELILEQTPFYAESGGEVADRGAITLSGGEVITVNDVQKINGIIHHFGTCASQLEIHSDDQVSTWVDTDYRLRKTRHHSATHLMHAALKSVVGEHVEQKGSVVEEARLRFDFSHAQPLSTAELNEIERWVNERIRRNDPIVIRDGVPIAEAQAEGAMALFGEKYGDAVRTIRAGQDSFELCGGNHAHRTGDIAYFVITGETGIAAGVRRIEAVVGEAAEVLIQADRDLLRSLGQTLKTNQARISERVASMQDEIRQLKKALKKARQSGGGVDIDAMIRDAIDVGGVPFSAARVDLGDRDSLGAALEAIRQKAPDMVVLLGAVEEESDKVMLTAGVGNNLKKQKKLHVGQLIRALAPLVGGKGGGRPDFANGGGVDASQLDHLIASAADAWRNIVS